MDACPSVSMDVGGIGHGQGHFKLMQSELQKLICTNLTLTASGAANISIYNVTEHDTLRLKGTVHFSAGHHIKHEESNTFKNILAVSPWVIVASDVVVDVHEGSMDYLSEFYHVASGVHFTSKFGDIRFRTSSYKFSDKDLFLGKNQLLLNAPSTWKAANSILLEPRTDIYGSGSVQFYSDYDNNGK